MAMNPQETAVALGLMAAGLLSALSTDPERPTPGSWLRLGASAVLLAVAMLYVFGIVHIGRA